MEGVGRFHVHHPNVLVVVDCHLCRSFNQLVFWCLFRLICCASLRTPFEKWLAQVIGALR